MSSDWFGCVFVFVIPFYVKQVFSESYNIGMLNKSCLCELTRSAIFARSIIELMSLLHSIKVRRLFFPEKLII